MSGNNWPEFWSYFGEQITSPNSPVIGNNDTSTDGPVDRALVLDLCQRFWGSENDNHMRWAENVEFKQNKKVEDFVSGLIKAAIISHQMLGPAAFQRPYPGESKMPGLVATKQARRTAKRAKDEKDRKLKSEEPKLPAEQIQKQPTRRHKLQNANGASNVTLEIEVKTDAATGEVYEYMDLETGVTGVDGKESC